MCMSRPANHCADTHTPTPHPPLLVQVCAVHNETTTGVTSDIKGVRKAMDAANHPALLVSRAGPCCCVPAIG